MRLKLYHKFLVLVAVPLIFELVFVATLVWLQRQAEYEAQRVAHSKAIIYCVNNVSRYTYGAGASLVYYITTHRPSFAQQFDTQAEMVPPEIEKLKDLLAGDPQRQTSIELIERLATVGLQNMEGMKKLIDGGYLEEARLDIYSRRREMWLMMDELVKESYKIIAQENAIQKTAPEAEAHWRELVVEWLWFGVIASIVLTVALAGFFNRDIISRLGAVIDNTVRLSKKTPLLPPVKGTDEIANLDKTFHDMASALDQAERHAKYLDEMKKEFIAIVSHDLRSPLTAVNFFLTALSEGAYEGVPDDVKRKAKVSHSDVTRLIDLVNNLLDIEKMESGKLSLAPKEVSVERLFERAIASVSILAEQSKVELKFDSHQASLTGDEDRLVQALVNLLSNAISFSPEGEKVDLSCSDTTEYLELRVTDRGPGIAEENKARIFNRFEQATIADERVRGGAGLGLAIAKAIVEEHGGTIGVDSEKGKGSAFWIRLSKVVSAARSEVST